MDEPVQSPISPAPTISQALGVIAATAVVQARELVVARLDHWAEEIRRRHEDPDMTTEGGALVTADEDSAPSLPASLLTMPVLVGAVTGATVAWLLARRPSPS